jgi:kumamolisin
MAKVILKGSERTEVPGASVLAPADATARLEVSVVVRRRARQALQTRVAQLASGNRAAGTLSREEFAAQHGADPADLAAVRKFAAAHGLTVVQEHAARRTVVLAGTVEQFNDAFSVKLQQFSHPEGTYRGRIGSIQLPQELDGVRYLNPQLYNKPQALRDITRGSNGEFEASMGWDACTGLGSPNGPVLRSTV